MFNLLEKNIWLSFVLLIGMGVLLAVTGLHLGGSLPTLKSMPVGSLASAKSLRVARAEEWFDSRVLAAMAPSTNYLNPFFTLHFQPPPTPPPPPTKKVELTYEGCIIPSSGEKRACIRLAGGVLTLTNGAKVIADHVIKAIEVSTLTLTNSAGQSNVLQFNVKQAIDVPAL